MFVSGQIIVSTIEGVGYKMNAVAKVHKLCGDTGKMIVIPMSGFKNTAPEIVTIEYWRKLED